MAKNKITRFLIPVLLFISTMGLGTLKAYDYEDRSHFVLAVLKYGGGGDWYDCLQATRNLSLYVQKNTGIKVSTKEKVVSLLDDDLFLYPFLFMNGHGNVFFTEKEAERLRLYLQNGGFLLINDDFGMDPYIRREMKKVFPDQAFLEVPYSHPVYNSYYSFPDGLPKVHEHEGGPARGFGIFVDKRMAVFYCVDSDIGDGWEEEWVHHDSLEVRTASLRMGVNIITYALTR